ncbi:serine hydrolase domain-containing protein [Brevibacillus reuszeri]|nr:serine hydrolase domain-containing protein [Brevibacillus reuszeri]MED1857407.1 serine hydrolase [Brevibacillus reuszeri]
MNVMVTAKIDSIFSRWQDGVCPGGQVLVRKDGEIIYDKCFGYASLEHKLPITGETVFHVASVSKQVTVMCVLLLHEDKLLDIDDDIRVYIADLVAFSEPVSIRNLMNNVSGVRDQWELLMLQGVRIDDTITQQDAKDVIASQAELNFPPLSRYMYSNANFTLLAEIVERVSGKSLNELARERIFAPLGMSQTCFKDRYWQMIPNRAESYKLVGSEYVHAVLNYGTYGATSLNTTATDFLKWMENLKNPVICNKETLSLLLACPTLLDGTISQYAGGIAVADPKMYKGRPFVGHDGSDAAFKSSTVRFTEEDIEIIIFSNTETVSLGSAVNQIADIVMGVEASQTVATEVPEFYRAEFDERDAAGLYFTRGEVSMIVEVTKQGDQLWMREGYGASPLSHLDGNRYRLSTLDADLFLGKSAGMRFGARFFELEKRENGSGNCEEWSGYTGKYESGEVRTRYEVLAEAGELFISHHRNGKHLMAQIAPDQFVASIGQNLFGITISFTRGDKGEVTGCLFSSSRLSNVAFTKV